MAGDPTTAQLVIEAYPLEEVYEDYDGFLDEDGDAGPAKMLRISMPVGTARTFARRTLEVLCAASDLRNLRPTDRPGQHTCTFPSPDAGANLGIDELTLTSRITMASNATFLGSIGCKAVVYKPIAGEKPLWDSPDGCLAHRDVAVYLVSEVLGWDNEVHFGKSL